ncbi:MAG: hypothetical protein Q4G42_00600 [Neisseria sp.]|nr:hypothetical protein [Neisseria sp.]
MSTWQPFPSAPNSDDKRGLLRPSSTREHHFIAQTEQRAFAFNPEVSDKNQNVYRFEKKPHGRMARAQSVNIENNLEGVNLYLLRTAAQADEQYNLEAWFNRYESAYDFALTQLMTLPEGTHAINGAYEAVWRMKLLNILRNPYAATLPVGQYLHRCLRARLPTLHHEIDNLQHTIAQHHRQQPYRAFGMDAAQYTAWLAVLCAALSEAVGKPSVFECFAADWLNARAGTVHHALFRYRERQCLFGDSGLCAQYGAHADVYGMPLSARALITAEIERTAWHKLPDLSPSYHAPQGEFALLDEDDAVRAYFNRRTLHQCRHAVYGQSKRVQDYV